MQKKLISLGFAIFLYPIIGFADVLIEVSDQSGQPLKDAVVYFEGGNIKPLGNKTSAEIIQKSKRFNPLITVVQTGSQVYFPNQDSVRHHVYSFSPIKKFELKLYSGIPANPVLFDKAGTAVLGCNIHDTMLAYVHVVDTPHFTKTDSKGMARLATQSDTGVQIKVWHYAQKDELSVYSQPLKVEADKPIRIVLDINQNALVN